MRVFVLMSNVDTGVTVICVSPGYTCPRTYIPREKCSPSDARAGYVFPTFYQCSVAATGR